MPFKKGQSGNPGGRPKTAEKVRLLAQEHSPEAIETLVKIMRNGKPDAARVMAADKILDRACGRAPQAHTGGDGEEPIIVRIVYPPREEKE